MKKRSEIMADHRRNRKQELVDKVGGKCTICFYAVCPKALEFHHLDESLKEFGIGNGNTGSLKKMLTEIEKCLLLCANCHREVHGGFYTTEALYEIKGLSLTVSNPSIAPGGVVTSVSNTLQSIKPRIHKHCKIHGLTEFSEEGLSKKRYRCIQCRNTYLKNRRKSRRKELLNTFNNECAICKYRKCDSALEFHHVDETSKDFNLGMKQMSLPLSKILEELKKVVLLCSNCHREVHDGKHEVSFLAGLIIHV